MGEVVAFSEIANQDETIVDTDGNPWFKQPHVGKFLDIVDIRFSLRSLDECEMCTRISLDSIQSLSTGWLGPKDQQNKTDVFLYVYGVLHIIIKSRKERGKELKE